MADHKAEISFQSVEHQTFKTDIQQSHLMVWGSSPHAVFQSDLAKHISDNRTRDPTNNKQLWCFLFIIVSLTTSHMHHSRHIIVVCYCTIITNTIRINGNLK